MAKFAKGSLKGKKINAEALHNMLHSQEGENLYNKDVFAGMSVKVQPVRLVFNLDTYNPGKEPKEGTKEYDVWEDKVWEGLNESRTQILNDFKAADMRFCKEMGIEGRVFTPERYDTQYNGNGTANMYLQGSALVDEKTGEPVISTLVKTSALNKWSQNDKVPVKEGAIEVHDWPQRDEPFTADTGAVFAALKYEGYVLPETDGIMAESKELFNNVAKDLADGKDVTPLDHDPASYNLADLLDSKRLLLFGTQPGEYEAAEKAAEQYRNEHGIKLISMPGEMPELNESLVKEPENDGAEAGYEM